MLSAGRKALCARGRWLVWKQYALVRPAIRARGVDSQVHVQKRTHIHTPPAAAHESNLLHWRKIHSSINLLGYKVVPFLLPDVGEGIEFVQINEWYVKVGDTVTMGDAACEVQSDKAAVTIYVPHDGVVKELMYEVNDTARRGKPLLTIEMEGNDEVLSLESSSGSESKVEQDIPAAMATQNFAQQQQLPNKTLMTPAVRRLAEKHGVDLSVVQGSGKVGRVLKEDILAHVEAMKALPPVSAPPTPTPATTIPSLGTLTQDRVVAVEGIRAVMVRTMTASGQIPQFGYCDEVDMTSLVELRSLVKEQLLERGVRFSYMPVIIKAVSLALHHYPILNSHTNPECTMITHKADHNIGVAMNTPKGLLVPNIKQCQLKSVFEIAVELNHIHELGLKNQLTPDDMAGGTFSLSNIGAIGGTYTKPMLLPPEVAIGGLGKLQVLPKFDSEDNLKKAYIMHVSWSADHRVIEGATVARFSNLWKSYFENPAALINTDLK